MRWRLYRQITRSTHSTGVSRGPHGGFTRPSLDSQPLCACTAFFIRLHWPSYTSIKKRRPETMCRAEDQAESADRANARTPVSYRKQNWKKIVPETSHHSSVAGFSTDFLVWAFSSIGLLIAPYMAYQSGSVPAVVLVISPCCCCCDTPT